MKPPADRNATNIVLTGVGGQGVVAAGMTIGSAATDEGMKVVMSEIHGMSQRGGIVSVDLRIGEVFGPIINEGQADLIIGFEAVETLRVVPKAKKNALILMSTQKIVPLTVTMGGSGYPDISAALSGLRANGLSTRLVDNLELAKEAGSSTSANLVMVGAAYSSGFLPVEYSKLEHAVETLFPQVTWEVNLRAMRLGMERYERGRA